MIQDPSKNKKTYSKIFLFKNTVDKTDKNVDGKNVVNPKNNLPNCWRIPLR